MKRLRDVALLSVLLAAAVSAPATVPDESRDRTVIERDRATSNYERNVAQRRRMLEEQKAQAESLMGMSWAEYEARRRPDGSLDRSPGVRAAVRLAYLSRPAPASAARPASAAETPGATGRSTWPAQLAVLAALAAGLAAVRFIFPTRSPGAAK
jgi:hypothetical protein